MLDELDDDYDDDYDDMDDYDDNEYYDDSGERYYEDADEDEYLCAKDLHNPANYYNPLRDSTYRSHDPNEYYNVFDDGEDYINGTNSTFDANVLGEDDNAFYCQCEDTIAFVCNSLQSESMIWSQAGGFNRILTLLGERDMGKKCEKCGAELKEDARFCTSCGAPVIDESEHSTIMTAAI